MNPEPAPGSSRFAATLTAGPVLLDGGLATQLEAQGATLSTALWSAHLLLVLLAVLVVESPQPDFSSGEDLQCTAGLHSPKRRCFVFRKTSLYNSYKKL